ncbi:MAG: hypothetical protein HC860_15335, partial [Alkalinema sp. RU_4_3]|nr:hypothetical protein [Alkalinema sp. RU_4_3]
IGAIGSVLIAGGQLAGVGSDLRRILAVVTGLLLVVLGLGQVWPRFAGWRDRAWGRRGRVWSAIASIGPWCRCPLPWPWACSGA